MTDETEPKTNLSDQLLRKILITNLGLSGVSQQNIRRIAGGRMNDITAIVKLLNNAKKKPKKEVSKNG